MRFFVPGVPRPKGSKTLARGNLVEVADMSKKGRSGGSLKSWMAAVAHAAVVYRDCRYAAGTAIAVRATFFVKRPKSARREHPCVKSGGDVDKLSRAVLDALEGVAYDNDAQVVDLFARKRYEGDLGPGVQVEVIPL